MTEEEIQALQDQLEAARAEAATHAAAAADAAAALAQAQAEHEATITAAAADAAAARAEAAAAAAQAEQATQAHQNAVTTYRDHLRAQNPLAPAELIDGATADAVTAAAARANALVETVRATLTQQAATAAVPAGAPPRSPPDISALSPIDKIAAALAAGRNGS